MGKGGSDTQQSTQTNTPWSGVQPSMLNYYNSLNQWMYGNPGNGVPGGGTGGTGAAGSAPPTRSISSFTNSAGGGKGGSPGQGSFNADWIKNQTVAGVPQATQQAWDLQTQRALQGSPVTQGAQNLAQQELSGQMLQPSFNAQFQPIAEQMGRTFNDITMPGVNSAFSAAGRTGSGAQQNAISNAQNNLGQSLGSLAGNIYGQERGYQQQAMQMAPTLAAQDYGDISQLGAVGEGQRAYQQQLLDAPYNQLQRMGGLLQPGLGYGSSTSTQPLYKNNPIPGLIGAGAGAYLGGPMGAQVGYTAGSSLGQGKG